MINDQTILSSFDDKPTLLEWLKKVEDALKTDTAKSISVENPEPNTYVFKITFADGTILSSGNVVFPNAVQDVSIKNGHIIVTQISGTQTDLGAINPYADTIVENAETGTTEIGNNVSISGNAAMGGNLGVTGQAVVGGRLQVNSSIISNGEIRGGNISGTKFLLGTEEMPLVKANPTGEATATLEKVKIGDVAYKVGGGGGSENEREYKLILPYSSTANILKKPINIYDENIWGKLNNYYYETIKVYYKDDIPLGIFNVEDYKDEQGTIRKKYSTIVSQVLTDSTSNEWYGTKVTYYYRLQVQLYSSSGIHYLQINNGSDSIPYYNLNKSKFDALYKLADKPTQDGNYILKASVSGGNVTYTWELQQ